MKSIGLNAPTVGTNGRNRYLDLLDEAWQAHLAPRAGDAPTVISLFAGCGGSSLGYSMAGYRELLAVEWDDNAVETFRLNFPDIPVWHGDIHKLAVNECLELTGLQSGELDVLDGSPPCQGFSKSGRRQINDKRNQLYMEYVRLLRGLKPKVFVMENVTGLVHGKMKIIFSDIMKELKSCGYDVCCKSLNAMYYSVPQKRERLIWIGVRKDLGLGPSFPDIHGGLVASSVIEGAPRDGLNGRFLTLDGKTSRYIKLLRQGERLESLYERIHGKGIKAYFAFSRLHPRQPSRTIVKNSAGLFHYTEHRTLTIGEYKRITSFPDDFRFIKSFNSALERIGNSVPPLFMRAIAQHIRNTVLTGAAPELVED